MEGPPQAGSRPISQACSSLRAGSAPAFGNLPAQIPSHLPSPGPSPSLSTPRFGFYKYMKMDEEEEDPRQRAFFFLGPDSESPAPLGTGPSSRHPCCWQLIPSELWLVGMTPAVPEAAGGLGCAEQYPSEHPSKRSAWHDNRAVWGVGSRTPDWDLLSLQHLLSWSWQWAAGTRPSVESGDVHGAWGCSWGTRGCSEPALVNLQLGKALAGRVCFWMEWDWC